MTAHREHIRIRYFAAAHAAATVDDEVVGCCAGDTLKHVLDRVADYRPPRAAVLPHCSHLQGKHFSEALGQTARKAFRFRHRSRIQIDCNAACFTA